MSVILNYVMSLMWLTAAAPMLTLTREEVAQGQEGKAKSQTGWDSSFCSMLNSAIQSAYARVTLSGFLILCKYLRRYKFRHG